MKTRSLQHRRLVPRSIYAAFVAALIAVELPFTRTAFSIFALPYWETTLMALGTGTGLIGLSHLLGMILARIGHAPDRTRGRVEAALGAVLALGLVLGVARLGQVRGVYLESIQRQLDLGLRLDGSTYLSFSFIQIIIVGAAVGMAYFVHNEQSDEIERLARAARRAARREKRAERDQLRAEEAFVNAQAQQDMIRLRYGERSAASSAFYTFLRWLYRATVMRSHADGPTLSLADAEMPPIEPGAWTNQPLEPYQLPGDEASFRPTENDHRRQNRRERLRLYLRRFDARSAEGNDR